MPQTSYDTGTGPEEEPTKDTRAFRPAVSVVTMSMVLLLRSISLWSTVLGQVIDERLLLSRSRADKVEA